MEIRTTWSPWVQDGSTGSPWIHLSPSTPHPQLFTKWHPLHKDWASAERLPPQQGRRGPHEGGEERQTYSLTKPHTVGQDLTGRAPSWAARGLSVPRTGHPNPGTCSQTKPPKHLALKPMEFMCRGPGVCGNLRHSCWGARAQTHPRNQRKGSSLRGDWILCEGDSAANPKASASGAGSI